MDDYRIKVGFFDHPKTVKLARRVGNDGVVCFIRLWEFCTKTAGRSDGNLAGLDIEDVEIAAKWGGTPGALGDALVQVRYLDVDESGNPIAVHDFPDHNPWVAGHDERSSRARKAGRASAKRRSVQPKPQSSSTQTEKPLNPNTDSVGKPLNPVSVSVSVSDSVSTSHPDPSPIPPPKDLSTSLREPDRAADIRAVFDHYRTYHPRAAKGLDPSDKEYKKIRDRLKAYSVEDLCRAIDGNHTEPFYCGVNDRGTKYHGLDLIMRTKDDVRKFIEFSEKKSSPALSEKTLSNKRATDKWIERHQQAETQALPETEGAPLCLPEPMESDDVPF